MPFKVKLEAFFHLTNNFAYPFLVALCVLMPISLVVRKDVSADLLLLDIPVFLLATVSIAFFYAAAQRETGVVLRGGAVGRAIVPSGASTGAHEAVELRDGGKRFGGKGVLQAVDNIVEKLGPALNGHDASDQGGIDRILLASDGSENKGNLGANAILACSMAVAHASARQLQLPLYRYLGGAQAGLLPYPMMNILNGGAHADNNVDIQEFMVMPTWGPDTFRQMRLRMGSRGVPCDSRRCSRRQRNLSTAVGDEGGFAPEPRHPTRDARGSWSSQAIESGRVPKPGDEDLRSLTIDCRFVRILRGRGSTTFHWSSGETKLQAEEPGPSSGPDMGRRTVSDQESIEDPLDENDWDGWKRP